MEELTHVSHKMAEAMYKAQAASEAAAGGEQQAGEQQKADEPKAEEKKDENVVDAEFEESKDE